MYYVLDNPCEDFSDPKFSKVVSQNWLENTKIFLKKKIQKKQSEKFFKKKMLDKNFPNFTRPALTFYFFGLVLTNFG